MDRLRPSTSKNITGTSSQQYRRGAIMGMTMAEAFILIAFILLLLLGTWKAQKDAETERFSRVLNLTQEELVAVVELSERGQLEAVSALVEDGLDFRSTEGLPDPADRWRLIDSDELRRMVDAAEDLPDDLQRDLADLVELEDARGIIEILERTLRAPKDSDLRRRFSEIGERIDRARAAERTMVQDLQKSLGTTVSEIGGYIEKDGSIVLPDTVLFDVGKSRITPLMKNFLKVACAPWLKVLMRSPAPVAGAQIEGHASSEWKVGTPSDTAYLKNLDLSQDRSAAVLDACLSIVSDTEVKSWAHKHLVAIGYSSARKIIENGIEDKQRSRRVVFSVDIDDDALLADVESNISLGLRSTD